MSEAAQIIGPLRVSVDPDCARAYAREIGADESVVPFAFPAVWLTTPTLYGPVKALCDRLDVVPVHEGQSFSYSSPLVAGENYDLEVTMRREETPPRLVLDACITTPEGAMVATIETMLRLVSRAGIGNAA